MILLSRILKYRANRWANIIAGIFLTAVQLVTLFVKTPTLAYVFFSSHNDCHHGGYYLVCMEMA